jgi:serine/threonine protein kinase
MCTCVIGDNFRLKTKIGSGGFGEIYIAEHIRTHRAVAVKLEPANARDPQLPSEAKLYQFLQGGPGIPHLRWFGRDSRYRVLAMDLLGVSLEDLISVQRKFSLKTVLMLADQMLTCVEFLHTKGYVHRDLKPGNFVIGRNALANQLFIIDYGLTKLYCDAATGAHRPFRQGKGLAGTVRYASVGALRGNRQSRRDDLQSLGYVLVYLLKGSLPWMGTRLMSGQRQADYVCDMKARTTPESLCAGLAPEFAHFVRSVHALKYEERPDYAAYREMFRALFIRKGYVYDYCYDWVQAPAGRPARQSIRQATPAPRFTAMSAGTRPQPMAPSQSRPAVEMPIRDESGSSEHGNHTEKDAAWSASLAKLSAKM